MPWSSKTAAVTRLIVCLLLASAGPAAHAQPAVLVGLHGVDQHGRAFDVAALAGRPVLMHFVYTGCGTTCPTQVHELAALHEALPAAQRRAIRFVSVSVDPLSDTPAALAAFARRMGAERAGWLFITGRPDALEPLYTRMQVFDPRTPSPGASDHRTSLYLYGADGRLLQRFRGMPVDRARLLAEISRL